MQFRSVKTMEKTLEIEKHYRRSEVEQITGLSRSTLYLKMAEGEFPRPVRMTAKAVAWPESALTEWLQSRPSA